MNIHMRDQAEAAARDVAGAAFTVAVVAREIMEAFENEGFSREEAWEMTLLLLGVRDA